MTLLIVTLLAWSAYRARTGSLRMHLLGLGPMLYYAYSYVINAFSPYNDVFVPCVVLIGMPAYALLDDVFRLDLSAVSPLWPQSPAGSWRCSWAWSRGSSPRCG